MKGKAVTARKAARGSMTSSRLKKAGRTGLTRKLKMGCEGALTEREWVYPLSKFGGGKRTGQKELDPWRRTYRKSFGIGINAKRASPTTVGGETREKRGEGDLRT